VLGYGRNRWSLELIAQACPWLGLNTASGVWQALERLGISYKRGRYCIYSPDRYYEDKRSQLQLHLLRAYYEPERYVFIYLDEFSYYRQPTLAEAYELKGHFQPRAWLSHQSDNHFRLIGGLNALTGQVTYRQHSKIDLSQMSAFYAALQADYPDAEEIYGGLDNWPIHFHPDVLARLQPQTFWPQAPKMPPKWPTEPGPKAIHDNLPIRLLPLPTYASWLNPIEKLWRWLNQEVLHLHPFCDDWPALKRAVASFLDQFRLGSLDLLRYVGLLPV
jgi:hypothetical protein